MIARNLLPDEADTFESLYERHERDVMRYAVYLMRDPHDGADVASEAFARALDAWRAGRGPTGRSLPWLLVITRRIAIDRLRRQRLVRWLPFQREHTAQAPDSLASREFWLWLDRLAECLSDRQREVIFLRYRRDLSDEEIGEVLGLTPSGVRSLLSRALKRLREHPELLR